MASLTESMAEYPWWLVLLEGIGAVIMGILLVIFPGLTTLVLVQTLGFYWLFVGILSLVGLFVDRTMWGWKLCSGILGIFAAMIIIRNPLWSTLFVPTVLVILLASLAILLGVIKLYEAFKGHGWGAGVLGALTNLFIQAKVAGTSGGNELATWSSLKVSDSV